MNPSTLLENQLLTTKFYVPIASGPLISRPRLTSLLNESVKYPLTLVSAAAGFGKTTLLSSWSQSLSVGGPRVAWISLDEEDNNPRLFWTYVLMALNRQQPERFTSLLMQLQSQQSPPLKYLLAELINLLVEGTDHFLLILDDYQMISERQVHATLAYLIEHLPAQLRLILATRADPPLPLALLRTRGQVLEVRTDQLRCTSEEVRAFFQEVIGMGLADKTIERVASRTEGWLVGLQLLGLSLTQQANPATLLDEVSGDQRYILDYLTEVALRRLPQEMQTFLLSTCILERLTSSLCDAVIEQSGSQMMLQQLEKANLFVVSLDSKRQWYRYHALFAEALYYQLERRHADLIPTLHHRASIWYAEHSQFTHAILHALRAQEWQWAADLIERIPSVMSLTWGAGEHELILLQQWLERLPEDVVRSRPRLCLSCAQMLWLVASPLKLQAWLDLAEATLTASLMTQTHADTSHSVLSSQARQDQENLLGEVIAFRVFIQSYEEDGQATLSLCQQALTLLSAENFLVRALVALAQFWAYYASATNDAMASVESGLQAATLAQAAEQITLVIAITSSTVMHMLGTGQLHKAERLTQQIMQLGTGPGRFILPQIGWSTLARAEVLREWNELDAALSVIEEAISLCHQVESPLSRVYLLNGYAVLLRVCLSRGDLDAACSALQQFEHIGRSTNPSTYMHVCSFFTTIDQVRLWLACGELNRAMRWTEQLEIQERHINSLALEREEVARVRILLATNQPDVALQRLGPVLQRTAAGKRWGHVIEIRLLQALAYQMCQEETQALDAISEAIHLAELEGYIRSFIEEGPAIEALLYRLRKRDRKHGPTPYLDTLLTAFQQENTARIQAGGLTKVQPLAEPLSKRELEVLQLLARGASNLEIAQELAIVIDTVKRHVNRIFSKLGVQSRIQAVRQAQALKLLDEEV